MVVLGLVALAALTLPTTPPIIPHGPVEVHVEIRSGDIADVADPWIIKAVLIGFLLLALGVLAWVARHLRRRDRKPDA